VALDASFCYELGSRLTPNIACTFNAARKRLQHLHHLTSFRAVVRYVLTLILKYGLICHEDALGGPSAGHVAFVRPVYTESRPAQAALMPCLRRQRQHFILFENLSDHQMLAARRRLAQSDT
jgi:hypothetical protein